MHEQCKVLFDTVSHPLLSLMFVDSCSNLVLTAVSEFVVPMVVSENAMSCGAKLIGEDLSRF